jgi:mycothiol synthase
VTGAAKTYEPIEWPDPDRPPTTWLDIPGAPSIAGLRVRHWRDVADYGPMAEAMAAASRADGVPWVPTADQLRIENEGHPGIDPAHDIVLAEIHGRIVAGAGANRVVRDGQPLYETWGFVEPDHRRRGLGSALLDWNVARSRRRAAIVDAGQPVIVQAHAEGGEAGYLALLAARGFETVRRFQLMRRDLTQAIEDTAMPDGLELRPVTPDQHRAIYEAQAEAFRDHWGSREPTEHGFEVTYGRKEIDTGLWVVAWDRDEIAGVIENWIWAEENAALGVERGWLEKVSVRRPWRRRGLGRAMTAVSLRRLRDAGMTEAVLGVDATNPNGAVELYRAAGFEIYRREFAYRRVYVPSRSSAG